VDVIAMTSKALIQPLRHVALLQGLPPLQVTEIARRALRVTFKPGDEIISAGATSDAAIVLVSGEAERISGTHGRPMAEIVPEGAVLAEMAMFVDTVHTSTVVARSPVRALRIDREDMLELIAAEPELAQHFIAVVSGRLKAVADEMRGIENLLQSSLETAAIANAQSAVLLQ
jgi:CRP-like cAMP-binding protein